LRAYIRRFGSRIRSRVSEAKPSIPLLSRAVSIRVLVLAVIIGALCGFSVSVYDAGLSKLEDFRKQAIEGRLQLLPLLAILGLLLSYLLVMSLGGGRRREYGTELIVNSYLYKRGEISPQDSVVGTISSLFTIGLGGSAGTEGPSLVLGGGLASFMASKLGVKPPELKVLMMAGAAAGLTSVFKAPLTAVLFAIEIPYFYDLATETFLPALLASLTSYMVVELLRGSGPPLSFPTAHSPQSGVGTNLIHVVLLGVVCGIAGVSFVLALRLLERLSDRLRGLIRPLVGGIALGAVVLVFPEVSGVGYDAIKEALLGHIAVSRSMVLALAKVLATGLTLKFGGSGGLFVPSLFVGCMLGRSFGTLVGSDPTLFSVVGMSAVLASTTKALFASVALASELTGHSAFVQGTVAAAVSYLISNGYSFYTSQVSKRLSPSLESLAEVYGELAEEDKLGKLESTPAFKLSKKSPSLAISMPKDEMKRVVSEHSSAEYPVTDSSGILLGVTTARDVADYVMGYASRLRILPCVRTYKSTPLDKLVVKMVKNNAERVYIVDGDTLCGVVDAETLYAYMLALLLS